MGIQCTDTINIQSLLEPLLLKSVFTQGGTGPNLDVLIDVMIQDKIEKSLLANINLPADLQDMSNVICLMLEMDKLKSLTAALKGEAPPAGAGLDKIINLIVQFQMLGALENAFGGGQTGSSGKTTKA